MFVRLADLPGTSTIERLRLMKTTSVLLLLILHSILAVKGQTTPNENWPRKKIIGNIRQPLPYGECDGCYCIPPVGENCPSQAPRTNFTTLIPVLRKFQWTNPYELNCDPYNSPGCSLTPPGDTLGTCVATFNGTKSGPSSWTYTVHTFPGTVASALAAGYYVTHAEPCGACSSLQDLAAYMETGSNLRRLSTQCGIVGKTGRLAGTHCFRRLGFTAGCAEIWYWNTVNTDKYCSSLCINFTLSGAPPNGPPPDCTLAPCLDCDEVISGPIFKKFAGRTRRSSGLLSDTVRACSDLVLLNQTSPCDFLGV